jgi:hypothetical protein
MVSLFLTSPDADSDILWELWEWAGLTLDAFLDRVLWNTSHIVRIALDARASIDVQGEGHLCLFALCHLYRHHSEFKMRRKTSLTRSFLFFFLHFTRLAK